MTCFSFFTAFLSLFSSFEIESCTIQDPAKHQANQKILQDVVTNELASCSGEETAEGKARYLSGRITQIADALLKDGFSLDAYAVPAPRPNCFAAFNEFTLWEGGEIPLTFFVYVWPPEESALKYPHPKNRYYASNIHSHPIPCALAVLQGTFSQKNYEQTSRGKARLIDEEVFQCGEGTVDNLEKPFIHQLCGRSRDLKACLTLHAYGLPTAKQVMDCFRQTAAEHSYKCAQ